MAANIVAENSNLVYFAHSRSNIPFDKSVRAHHYDDASASLLLACSGDCQKDESKRLSNSVNRNQLMRRRRIGLGFFPNLLWALMFGHYFNINQDLEKKKSHSSYRRKYAPIIFSQKHF
jgi:hypothetical protein